MKGLSVSTVQPGAASVIRPEILHNEAVSVAIVAMSAAQSSKAPSRIRGLAP